MRADTARLRKALEEYVAARGASVDAYIAQEKRAGLRLAECAVLDLPAILDAVDAGPTFLEHHARTLEAHAKRTAEREELAAGRKLMRDLVDGGCIDPNGDSALVHRVVAFAEGK